MHRFLVGSVLACLCGGAVATSAQLLNTHAGLGAPAVGGGGGGSTIAFVAAGDIGNNGGSSGTLSGSYSQSNGTNEGLVVCITGGVIGTDADDITSLQELLAAQRRTLAVLLRQLATLGADHAPPGVHNGINEARAEIARLKAALRDIG